MLNGALLSTLVCSRSEGEARPSVLVVDRDADCRLFLRSSLRRRCRVVTTASGEAAAAHLRHCPPRALIVGGVPAGKGREALRAELRDPEAPAVLRLWTVRPPSEWADATLRHPFTRAELMGAVDHLLRNEAMEADALPGGPSSRR